jgi:hypothetical protein
MATALKLKNDINKLKAALRSKATPKSFIPKLKSQLEKAEADYESVKAGKKSAPKAGKQVKSTMDKLKAIIKKKKYGAYRAQGVDLKKDADRPALPTGKRISKNGNTYYEYRANRIDVKQPPKRYPKLEKGGYMAKGGEIKKGEKYAEADDSKGRIKKGDSFLENNGDSYRFFTVVDMRDNTVVLKDENNNIEYFNESSAKKLADTEWHKSVRLLEVSEIQDNDGNKTIILFDDNGNRESFKYDKFKNLVKSKEFIKADEDKMASGGYMAKGGEFTPTKEIYSGKFIKIKMPKIGDFKEEKIFARYDKEDFIFKIYDEDKKRVLRRMGALDFENNLMNGSYVIEGYMTDGGMMAKGGELKEDDFVWNEVGKKLVVDKVTDTEYFLKGFMQTSTSPFSKNKVDTYIKLGKWSLKPKMADGGVIYLESVGTYFRPSDLATSAEETFTNEGEIVDLGDIDNEEWWDALSEEDRATIEKYKAKGGMMAKGGDLSSIKKKYEENEDENAHSENVVLLAKHFGTKEDLAKAKEILALHEKEGSLSSENGKKRQELHLKLIGKARAEMGKQGIEFEKGGYMAKGGDIGIELMGGQSNSELKPSGYKLISKKGNEIIVSDDGGQTKERYVKNKYGVSGYRLVYNGNDYEFTDSFKEGGYMAHGGELHRSKDSEYKYGGYMAMGGALSHGLKEGDHIMVVKGNILGIKNEETGEFATLDISTGERNDAPHLKESLGLMKYYSRNKE